MRLRTLATVGLILVLGGLLVLAIWGAGAWRDIDRHVDRITELEAQQQRIDQMVAAIDYTTLLLLDPTVIQGLVDDARILAEQAAAIDHRQARLAASHLEEIAVMGELLLESAPEGVVEPGTAAPGDALMTVSRQIRIHHAGAREAFAALLGERNHDMLATLYAGARTLVMATLLFALLALVTALVINRRLVHPIRTIDAGLKAMSRGDLHARIDLNRNDELGQLARSFNRMARQRGDYQAQLKERIKELRCLYQVLELTTSGEMPPEAVAERIVNLVPESLQYEAEAVVCIDFRGKRFTSPGWAEPLAQIDSEIRIDDQVIGHVSAGYRSRPEQAQPGAELFLPEERSLINGIAKHFSRMVQQRQLAESLAHSERLKAVGELTGGMAHDFNNLLTVIIGNAELLHEQLGNEDHPQADLAEMIVVAGQRGSELTQRMLAFARQQVLEPKVVDINRLLGGIRGLLERTLGEDVELRLAPGYEALPAVVDPAQIESAILNLCLNARDAMPGGGRLTVETQQVHLDPAYTAGFEEVEPGPYVLLAVSDTGSGIQADTIERVFEPFFTTKDHGTGLGLSMVYGLVKQLRGHIRIYSEPDQGTTVRIYLPLAKGVDPDLIDADREPADLHGDETILLVEDNDLVREYACKQLAGLGYRVIEAVSGHEALTVLRERDDIDLLFTDVVMPGGMNGRQLVDQARTIRPGLRVLYTSGYTQNAIVHHGRLDAGVELLAKPYHRRDLARHIRKVLLQPAPDPASDGND